VTIVDNSTKYSLKDELTNLKGLDSQSTVTMFQVLEVLRVSFLSEFSAEHVERVHPLVWKTAVTYQCLVRRTVETADGLLLGWNAGNIITAVTMARSLIETASLVFDLTEGLEKAVKNKNLHAFDDLVNKRLLGTRDESLLKQGAGYAAANVLTFIDKLDRFDQTLHKGKPGARKRYDQLSGFVHPNYHGVVHLYGELNIEKHTMKFGTNEARRNELLVVVGKGLAVVGIVELCRRKVIGLIPAIYSILGTQSK
jgi:hypothetical protein